MADLNSKDYFYYENEITENEIKLGRGFKEFKCIYGTEDKKKRPGSIFVVVFGVAKPKMSIETAKSYNVYSPYEAKRVSFDNFRSSFTSKKLSSFFSSQYFKPSTVSCSLYDQENYSTAVGHTPSFMKLTISMETVNCSNSDGKPIAHKDGKIYKYSFDDFKNEIKETIKRVLKSDLFVNNYIQFIPFNNSNIKNSRLEVEKGIK